MLSLVLTLYSFSDIGRVAYLKLAHRNLKAGIDRLFQNPNKYRDVSVEQDYGGSVNAFYLQKDKHTGFNEMKKLLLDNFYKKESELGYDVKVIVQWQAIHIGPDAQNPIFNKRIIGFIPLTDLNKNIDFKGHEDEMLTNMKWITHQDRLTQDLDTLLTNEIVVWATIFVVLATLLGSYVALKYD